MIAWDRPAVAIVIEVEESEPKLLVPIDVSDRARLADWIASQPTLERLLGEAFDASGILEELRAEDEASH